jgi:hypothetical protein
MKKYLFGSIVFALLGTDGFAQQTPAAVSNRDVAPNGGAPLVGCQDGGSCAPTKTICVPECYTKKTKEPVYCCGCEPFCLCYFHCHFGHRNCDSGHCEHPYTRRYLLKKSSTCEEQCIKCVPREVPACDCAAHGKPWHFWGHNFGRQEQPECVNPAVAAKMNGASPANYGTSGGELTLFDPGERRTLSPLGGNR